MNEMPFLNTCRWVSAALVAYGHIFLLVYPSFTFRDSALGAALVALAKLRYLAVTVFFVVSGYLIGGGILVSRHPFSWWRYFSHRFARIYAPLIPAIVLTIVLDHLALSFDPHAFVYTVAWPTNVIGPSPPIQNYHFVDIFASVFSVESFVGNPIGSNAPLWSLGLEWCFYFIFPLIVILCNVQRLLWQLVGVLLVTVVLWFAVGDLCSTWLIWCSGALARRWLGSRVSLTVAVYALGVMIGSVASSFIFPTALRPVFFSTFGFGLAVFLQNKMVLGMNLGVRSDKVLADFSYSLYITHVPVAVFCIFLATTYASMPIGGYPSLMHGAGLFVTILAVAFANAWIFGLAFEGLTPQLRNFMQPWGNSSSVIRRG